MTGWAASRAPAALLCLAALPGAAPRPATVSLEIEVTKLRSQKGVIQLCLTSERQAFPDCRAGNAVKRTVPADAPRIRIEGLVPGSYAFAVIHDENANAKLDTMLGIPREGFGFSRDAAVSFGPPRFAAAEFRLEQGTPAQQVKMRYLL